MKGSKFNPSIAVVVNTYNHESFILECLGSIHSQTYTNWNLLVYDACSKDDTVSKVYNFCLDKGLFPSHDPSMISLIISALPTIFLFSANAKLQIKLT